MEPQPGRETTPARILPSGSVWDTVQERVDFLEEIADFLEDYPSAYLPHIYPVPEIRSLTNGQTLPFPTGMPSAEEIDTVSMSLPAIVYREAEKELWRASVNQGVRLFTPSNRKLTKPGVALFCDVLGIEQTRDIAASSENPDLEMMLAPVKEHSEFRDPELVAAFYRQIAHGVAAREDGVVPSGAVPEIAKQVMDMPKPKQAARRSSKSSNRPQPSEDAQDSAGGPPLLLNEIPEEEQQKTAQMQYQQGRQPANMKNLVRLASVFAAGGLIGHVAGATALAAIGVVANGLGLAVLFVGIPAYLAIKLKGDFQRLRQAGASASRERQTLPAQVSPHPTGGPPPLP